MKYFRYNYHSIIAVCIVTILAIFLFITNLAADTDTRIKEIQDRLEELANEAGQYSNDINRLNDIMKEMQTLSQELQQLTEMGESGTGNITKEAHAAADAAARSALSGQEDDPCYNCKYQKEYANALFGSTLPWVRCIPVYFYLTWQVDETYHRHSGFPEDKLIYTLEENYPGCLHLVYDQKTLSNVDSFLISGPLPQKNSVIAARLTKISAHLIAEVAGVLKSTYKTASTTSIDHFRVDIDHMNSGSPDPGIEFSYTVSPLEEHSSFEATRIYPIDEKIVGEPYSLVAGLPESITGIKGPNGIITLAELKKGLQKGELEKSFSLDYMINYPGIKEAYTRKGTVTVKMLFNRKPGTLEVTPAKEFKTSGPDCEGNFNPGSVTFTIKNTGDSEISFEIQKKADWLSFSKKSGTLTPEQSTAVTIKINEKAKSMKDGEYSEEVKFTNTTDGKGNTTRKVLLDLGEEQKWRLFLTGYEKREYKIPKWKTPNNQDIIYGGRFNYKMQVEFIIKKKKGKWIYKRGTITVADIGYGTLYDTNAWAMRKPVNLHFSSVTGLKGTPIAGTVDNNQVRFFWKNPIPPPGRSLDAMFKLPCKPMPDCQQWGGIEYVSDEFLDRAGDHYLKLIHEWTSPLQKPFIIERPDDKLCWLRYNYTLRKVCPE